MKVQAIQRASEPEGRNECGFYRARPVHIYIFEPGRCAPFHRNRPTPSLMADLALKPNSKSSLADLVSVSPSTNRVGEKKSSPVLVALGNNEENERNTVHGVTVNRENEQGGYKLYKRRWLGLCESSSLLASLAMLITTRRTVGMVCLHQIHLLDCSRMVIRLC